MSKWSEQEHVLAGPFAEILRRACAEEREIECRNNGPFASKGRMGQTLPRLGSETMTFLVTSRNELSKRYAERYGVSLRTADRHFSLVLSQPTIPVYIADRIAALLGEPLAYIEATA